MSWESSEDMNCSGEVTPKVQGGVGVIIESKGCMYVCRRDDELAHHVLEWTSVCLPGVGNWSEAVS